MHMREIVTDVGWLLLMLLALPIVIPVALIGFIVLRAQRLYAWRASRSAGAISG